MHGSEDGNVRSCDGALAGRTALITGAASGIGSAIAAAFAREGASLALFDRNRIALEAMASTIAAPHVSTHVVDVTNVSQVCETIEIVKAQHGSLDVLVNSAGILTQAPLIEMDVQTWDETIEADLRSVFLCCRFVVPHMVEAGWGRVINIASQLGQRGEVGLSHYSAAKAGVIGFTRALAREVAPHNVLVNAIAPGPIDTPFGGGLNEEWKARKEPSLPLRRVGRPEEVAPSAVLLASDPGGNLYVGQTLGPNSGDVML